MKKIITCLALVSLSFSTFANDFSFEEAKNLFKTGTPKVAYFDVVSLQPDIITDKECKRVFSQVSYPINLTDYQSRLLEVANINVQYTLLHNHSIAVFMISETTINLPGKKPLVTPRIVSTVFDSDKLEDNGSFFSYYCTGKVHGQR